MSTKEQGKSVLGLESQRESVTKYVSNNLQVIEAQGTSYYIINPLFYCEVFLFYYIIV